MLGDKSFSLPDPVASRNCPTSVSRKSGSRRRVQDKFCSACCISRLILNMRGRMDDRKSYAKPLQVGDVMVGEAVARVIESRHPEYSERDIVLAQTGWRTPAVADGAGVRKIDQAGPPVTTRLGARHAGVHGLFQPARGCSRDCGRSSSVL